MSKIDLIDNKWSDLVFEGKNQAYGAYQLRRETGKRNVKALLVMFAIGVAIAAFVAIKGVVENAMKKVWMTVAESAFTSGKSSVRKVS